MLKESWLVATWSLLLSCDVLDFLCCRKDGDIKESSFDPVDLRPPLLTLGARETRPNFVARVLASA